MATAADLLKEVIDGASRARGNIQLKDVEHVLGNETFARDMLVTSESGNSLLHLAARGHVESVLPLVVQAFKRAKLFSTAMAVKNGNGWNPLHEAVRSCNFENTVFLFKECLENYPEAFEPAENGWTVLHLAANGTENLNVLKYLLSKDVCQPMLLVKCHTPRHKDALPMDIAKALVFQAEFEVQNARRFIEFAGKNQGASHNKDFMHKSHVEPKKKALEKAKEVLSVIQQPTMEAKAKEAERLAMEIERKKFLEREEKIITELQQLLQLYSWSIILEKYMLCDSEETQKITVGFLAKSLSGETPSQLPPLSLDIVKVIMGFLVLPESDPALLSTLTLLGEFTKSNDNNKLLFASREESELDIISKVVVLLCSLEKDIQGLCVSALLNLTTNKPDKYKDEFEFVLAIKSFVASEDWIQPLLLVNHFSLDGTVKSLATQTLSNLGVGDQQPDPGSWSVRDVSLWMESNVSLEKRSEYRKKFAEGGIDGLHLLELSASEMTGLGVKFVSNQRKLSSLIDELRRMNMRSIVGQKDIFLSYAHINIHFARRIKKVLNAANYSVWIDEAGIRAGHKWRNEIADGIQGCRGFLFIMTPRSTNSEYCQDELALAEEYKKPILTLRLETVSEIDPGLKLIIQKRQNVSPKDITGCDIMKLKLSQRIYASLWIDFLEDSEFEVSSKDLVNAICTTVGSGSGPEQEDEEDAAKYTTESIEAPDSNREEQSVSPLLGHNDHTSAATIEELLSASMAALGGELRGELRQLQVQIQRLEAKVDELSGQVQAIENRL